MKERLHVLLVPDWYPSPENPVAGQFMRDLAHAIEIRHAVTVLAPPSAAAPSEERDGDLRVLRTTAARKRGKLATLHRLRALDATVARLRREGQPPDLIHAHIYSAGFLAVLVGRRRGLPVVVTSNYGAELEGALTPWNARIARLTYRHANMVCPDSRLQEASLARLEPRGRYQVVPEVVDIDTFAGAHPSRRRLPGARVVAVSMLFRQKGLRDLIEAIRLTVARGREVELSIIGDGPEHDALAKQAEGLPVRLLGALPRDEVAAHVRGADVFAMPTHGDAFGIAAVEALAAGTRVVVTSAAGAADLISAHGGRVVPPAAPAALAAAIVELLDSSNAVPAGTADALRRYCGPEAVAEQYDSVYRSVLRNRRRG